jgi:hypothetical protein
LDKIFQPDLVLLDNRPSARTSADIVGIKTAAALNVAHEQLLTHSLLQL